MFASCSGPPARVEGVVCCRLGAQLYANEYSGLLNRSKVTRARDGYASKRDFDLLCVSVDCSQDSSTRGPQRRNVTTCGFRHAQGGLARLLIPCSRLCRAGARTRCLSVVLCWWLPPYLALRGFYFVDEDFSSASTGTATGSSDISHGCLLLGVASPAQLHKRLSADQHWSFARVGGAYSHLVSLALGTGCRTAPVDPPSGARLHAHMPSK